MRRRLLIRPVLCLLPGAVTSVAIALALGRWRPPLTADLGTWAITSGNPPTPGQAPVLHRQSGPGRRVYSLKLEDARSAPAMEQHAAKDIPALMPFAPEPDGYVDLVTEAFGWPAPCLSGSISYGGLMDAGGTTTYWPPHDWSPLARGPIRTPTDHDLPMDICWPGLAIDSAFWGAAWWLGTITACARRARTRKRRGLCPNCTYDLKGIGVTAGCPECGWGRA